MSLPEKSPEPVGDAPRLPQPATPARSGTPENDSTTVVEIESSLAAWTCVFGSFLFLMPTFGTHVTHIPLCHRVNNCPQV